MRSAMLLLLIGTAAAKLEAPSDLLRLLSGPHHDYEAWTPHEPPRRRFEEPQESNEVGWSDGSSEERDYDSSEGDEMFQRLSDEDGSAAAEKRSAVMAALTAGGRRLRRVPAPQPQHASKAVGPFVEIGGVLDSLGDFMGSLRHTLKVIHDEGADLRHAAPSVVLAGGGDSDAYNSGGGGGGGGGSRRLYALRPLHPNMHTRSYDRRSFVGPGSEYRGANQHDPGLLWTGLGRRRRR